MSTSAALQQHARSWSEENLFQIQTKEKIERLEAELKVSANDSQALTAELAKKDQRIAELEKIEQDHLAKLYFLRRYEKADQEKKEKTKAKKAAAKKKRAHARAKKPLLPHEKAAQEAKARAKAQKVREAQTENLLKEVQDADAKREKEAASAEDSSKAEEPSEGEVGQECGDASAGGEAEESGVFDLELVAKHLPEMPIGAVIEAERRFIDADEDGSGLIDRAELQHIIDHEGGVDMELVERIIAQLQLDVDAGLDFLDCLKISTALQQEAAKAKASAAADKPAAASEKPGLLRRTMSRRTASKGAIGGDEEGSKACSIQ